MDINYTVNASQSTPVNRIGKNTYLGISFIALSTLMYEILLTRIFSVTMGYHFAFMAISIAMFGMTLGAMLMNCVWIWVVSRGPRP